MSDQQLLHSLLARWEQAPPGNRPSAEQLCPHDPELREELQGMIDLLQTGDSRAQATAIPSAISEFPQLDRYRIVREIGRGGQGAVYLAVQKSTSRQVAVKLLATNFLGGDKNVTRFDREVQILALLNHPHVVTVLDRGRTIEGLHYLVMNYINGQPLDTYGRPDPTDPTGQRRTLGDPQKLLPTFLKICEAVNAAHSRGIVHRDLKPSNILIDEYGEPHVLDFGLARPVMSAVTAESARAPLTLTGEFLGSLPYASPEQAAGDGSKIDARSDVYSLGVMLYQLLTGGQFPYQVVGSIRDVLDNIATAQPQPPSAICASRAAREMRRQAGGGLFGRRRNAPMTAVNDELDAIVLKALSKRGADRYQTAGELSADLTAYLSGQQTAASVDREAAGYARGHQRKATIIAAVIAIVLVGTAAAVYLPGVIHEWRKHAPASPDAFNPLELHRDNLLAASTSSKKWLGFESPGATVAKDGSPVLAIPQGSGDPMNLVITPLQFVWRDEATPVKLWVPASQASVGVVVVGTDPTGKALVQPTKPLPDGPYCLHYGNFNDGTPSFAARFVVRDWSLPKDPGAPVKQPVVAEPPKVIVRPKNVVVASTIPTPPSSISPSRILQALSNWLPNPTHSSGFLPPDPGHRVEPPATQAVSVVTPLPPAKIDVNPPVVKPAVVEPPLVKPPVVQPSSTQHVTPPVQPPPVNPIVPPVTPPVHTVITPPATRPVVVPPVIHQPSPVVPYVPPPPPVAHWTFDDLTEPTRVLLSNDSITPQIILPNNVTTIAGIHGKALHMTGQSRLSYPDRPDFNPTTAITLAAWIRVTVNNDVGGIACKWTPPDSYGLFWVGHRTRFSIGRPKPDGGSETFDAEPSDPGPLNHWSHVAGVYDGHILRLYEDGKVTAETQVVAADAPAGPLAASAAPVVFASTGGIDIDDVRLYDVALTQQQIIAIAGRMPTTKPSSDGGAKGRER